MSTRRFPPGYPPLMPSDVRTYPVCPAHWTTERADAAEEEMRINSGQTFTARSFQPPSLYHDIEQGRIKHARDLLLEEFDRHAELLKRMPSSRIGSVRIKFLKP